MELAVFIVAMLLGAVIAWELPRYCKECHGYFRAHADIESIFWDARQTIRERARR